MAAWVANRIDECDRGFGECQALGVIREGEIVAGLVFHNWQPQWGTIEISGAAESPRCMSRQIISDALKYPFSFCQMVVAQCDLNSAAHKLMKRLGADEYVIPRLRGFDREGVILTLTREQWQAGKFYKGQAHVRTESA